MKDYILDAWDGLRYRYWLALAKSLRFIVRGLAGWSPLMAVHLEDMYIDMNETIAEWEKDFEAWRKS